MGLLFLAVCSVFGVVAIVLWAALASARVTVRRAQQLATDLLTAVHKTDLPEAERAALSLRYAMVFGDGTMPVTSDTQRS